MQLDFLSTQQFAVAVLWMESTPPGYFIWFSGHTVDLLQWSIKKLAAKVAAAAILSNGWVYCGIFLLFVCPVRVKGILFQSRTVLWVFLFDVKDAGQTECRAVWVRVNWGAMALGLYPLLVRHFLKAEAHDSYTTELSHSDRQDPPSDVLGGLKPRYKPY